VVELVEELKDKGRFVKYVRLDDARENYSIERASKEKYLGIKFEFSVPRTPQRNGKFKRKLQKLYGSVISKLNDAGMKEEMKQGIWAECASTATFYANILVNRDSEKSPHESMFLMNFKNLSNLKRFVEIL
jgi:hypothetical protein